MSDHLDACLAVLASEFDRDVEALLKVLLEEDGDLDRARSALARPTKKRKATSLSGWLNGPEAPSKTSSTVKKQLSLPPLKPTVGNGNQPASPVASSSKAKAPASPPKRSINDALKRDTTASAPAALPPLTLDTPAAVAKQVPCMLMLNVLPAELASDLFLQMMEESESWTRNKWYMVDREVESPHLTAFYADQSVEEEASSHWYAGRKIQPPRTFTPLMLEARTIVEAKVAEVLANHPRDPLEHADSWRANVAAANRYYGRQSNVGFHADQLTYLGPSPTIGSISLGCQRVFRLRGGSPARTYNIPLPHNSLLLMLAGCQERYKHCVPPANALDVFKPITDTQRRSFGDRINITYRFYRPDFSSPPVCACGVPCLLRSDLKHNVTSSEARYFWQCQAAAQNEGKSCGHWMALDMAREGKGPLWGDVHGK